MKSRDTILSKKKWFTLDDSLNELKNLGLNITKADLIHFGATGDLILSTYLQDELAKPVYQYSWLPDIEKDECVYKRIAERYLNVTSDTPVLNYESVFGESHDQIGLQDEQFLDQLIHAENSHKIRLKQKANEVFERWKKQGYPHTKYEHGDLSRLSGLYSLDIGGTLRDSLITNIHGSESNDLITDGIVRDNSNDEEFMFFSINGKRRSFVIPESRLVIQYKHFHEFLEFINDECIPRHKNTDTQTRRENVLARYAQEVGKNCFEERRIDVWNELSNLDHGLFPYRDDPDDQLVKKFFDNQKLVSFSKGRRKQ